MKRMITPCHPRGSIANNVQAALRELQKLVTDIRGGVVARTVAGTTGYQEDEIAELLSYALAVIEEKLAHAHSAIPLVDAREHLRRFRALVEAANRSAQIDQFLQRAKTAHGRKPDPSKTTPKNDLKRLANSGGPHSRQG